MLNPVRLLLLIFAVVNAAQGTPCFVDSTNHGGGLFSYTFRRGDAPAVFGLSFNGSYIRLQSYEVVEIQDAPGWTHTISASGVITWSVSSGTIFLDQPVTFSVRSRLTESTTYSNGVILGSAFELPDRLNLLGGGFQTFTFLGPALPSLRAERNGANLTITWPTEVQGLQLEASDALGVPASWIPVPIVPTIVNSNATVEVPVADRQKLFRLALPTAQ